MLERSRAFGRGFGRSRRFVESNGSKGGTYWPPAEGNILKCLLCNQLAAAAGSGSRRERPRLWASGAEAHCFTAAVSRAGSRSKFDYIACKTSKGASRPAINNNDNSDDSRPQFAPQTSQPLPLLHFQSHLRLLPTPIPN